MSDSSRVPGVRGSDRSSRRPEPQAESSGSEASGSVSELATAPDTLLRLQRTVGNQAVLRLFESHRLTVQRAPGTTSAPTREELDAAYRAAVAGHQWADAAVKLNGFNDADIAQRVRALSPADRDAMLAATPDWDSRVRAALLDAACREAVGQSNWPRVALLLNGFNDPDIASRVAAFNPSQLLALRQAAIAGGQTRISQAIDARALVAPQSSTNTTDTGNAYTSTMALFPNGLIVSKDVHFIQTGTFGAGKFEALKARVVAAVTTYLSGKYKLKIESASGTPEPGDGTYPITVQVVDNASASYPLTLHGGAHGRSGVTQAGGDIYELGQASETSVPDITLGHESAHMILGASDEYANASVPGRVITNDHSLMGNFYTQGIAAAEIKARHFQFLVTTIQARYPGRTVSIVK